jgi:hypothetical protein
VYCSLGVPEFTDGKLLYAPLNDEKGWTLYTAEREAIAAYYERLKTMGFRPSSDADRKIEYLRQGTEGFNTPARLYPPTDLQGWTLEIWYDNTGEGGTRGTKVEFTDPATGKAAVIYYNMALFMEAVPRRAYKIGAGLLENIGISDKGRIPRNAKTGLEKNIEPGRYAPPTFFYMEEFNFDRDYELTTALFREWADSLKAACAAAADDHTTGAMPGVQWDERTAGWQYRRKGKTYKVSLNFDKGFNTSMRLVITE